MVASEIVRLCILVPTAIFVVGSIPFRIRENTRRREHDRAFKEKTRRFRALHERRMNLVRSGAPCGPPGVPLTYDNLDQMQAWLDHYAA